MASHWKSLYEVIVCTMKHHSCAHHHTCVVILQVLRVPICGWFVLVVTVAKTARMANVNGCDHVVSV